VALFRRGAVAISNGLAVRGFEEATSERLRDAVLRSKPLDLDTVREKSVVSDSAVHASLRSIGEEPEPALVIPLRGNESEAGLLWIFEGGRPFGIAEIERAEMITNHAQLALVNAERYNHAKERAFVDDVTEVYNARYLLQATEHEMQRAERYGRNLSVLFLDLDRFKLVNDNHGHLVGSQILRQLSDVLGTCIRQIDTLARYGGDEFTVLLPDTDHASSLVVAERIRATVAATRFEDARGAPIHLEISIGVATYPEHGGQRDELLDAADKAMYRAKSQGRNCVCSASALTA